jgi:hypothetical protein
VEERFDEEGEEEGGEGVSLEDATVDDDGDGRTVGGDIVGDRYTVELFASAYEGRGHTELAHVFEHDAAVCDVEGAFEVRVHAVDVLVVSFGIFHHHGDGGKGVVDVALVAESIMLVAEDAVSFCIFGACVIY